MLQIASQIWSEAISLIDVKYTQAKIKHRNHKRTAEFVGNYEHPNMTLLLKTRRPAQYVMLECTLGSTRGKKGDKKGVFNIFVLIYTEQSSAENIF